MVRRTKAIWVLLASVMVAFPLFAGVLSAPPANAQTVTCTPPDPYTHQQQCTLQINLHLSITFGPAGITIRITAFGFLAGDPVTGTFDGVQVFTATARAGVGQVAAAANPAAALAPLFRSHIAHQVTPTLGGIDQSFAVPNKPPGEYAVCVFGSGAQGCGTFRIVPAAQVLGVQITRPDQPANAAPASNGNVSGVRPTTSSPLARTGMNVGLLVMLGVGLLAVGRYLRAVAKRRRPAGV
jgi:hypothetical protein